MSTLVWFVPGWAPMYELYLVWVPLYRLYLGWVPLDGLYLWWVPLYRFTWGEIHPVGLFLGRVPLYECFRLGNSDQISLHHHLLSKKNTIDTSYLAIQVKKLWGICCEYLAENCVLTELHFIPSVCVAGPPYWTTAASPMRSVYSRVRSSWFTASHPHPSSWRR